MTNLQAIDLLKGLEQSLDDYCKLNDEGKTAFRMAITALEVFGLSEQLPSAQPDHIVDGGKMDCISRQAAIDALDGEITVTGRANAEAVLGYANLVCDRIKRLPSAQPEQRWIPCSERLPEQYGNYLISIHGEDEPDIGTINPNDKRGWSLCDANGFHWASDKKLIVTAWMPLPEPYRGGGAE